MRPQGIETLRERSAILLPVGKHKGKTHRTAFEQDMAIAALMSRKETLAKVIQELQHCPTPSNGRGQIREPGDREPESVHQGGQEGQEPRAPKAKAKPAKDSETEGMDGSKLCSAKGQTSSFVKGKRTTMKEDMTAEQKLELLAVGADCGEGPRVRDRMACDQAGDAGQHEEQLAETQGDADFQEWMRYKLPRLDALEVSGADSSFSNAVRKHWGRVLSIKTCQSNQIWQLLHMREPQHLWTQCGSTAPSRLFRSTASLQAMYDSKLETGIMFNTLML